jgi:hypothetical protein
MRKLYTYWRSPLQKQLVGIALIMAHGLIIVTYALFLHTHVLDDGTRVVHAHPFTQKASARDNDNGDQSGTNHDHNAFGYFYFSSLGQWLRDNPPAFKIFIYEKHLIFFRETPHASIRIPTNISLRAPPIF